MSKSINQSERESYLKEAMILLRGFINGFCSLSVQIKEEAISAEKTLNKLSSALSSAYKAENKLEQLLEANRLLD